jgi:hypothetical protein
MCRLEKPETEYYPDTAKRDGLGGKCRACTSIYNARRYAENGEAIRTGVRAYYAKHRETINARRAGSEKGHLQYQRWYARNAEHKRAYCREYGRTHPRVLR